MAHGNEQSTDAQLELATEAVQKAEEKATAGQLALEMMHEIKNPLEALGHLTYLTLQEADCPENVRNYMHLAEEQMDLLRDVASQTLGFARTPLRPRPMEAAALVASAMRIHQRALDAKHIHLITDLAPGVVAEVYPSEILQVLSNLIVNALDALPQAGTLHLRVRGGKGQVHFVVADRGYGIAHTNLTRLFEPYFTTKESRGNGFGLALCKKIIQKHDGKILVRSSVLPGKSGTVFRVSLPRVAAQPKEAGQPGAAS